MPIPEYDSPLALRRFLAAEGLAMSKKYGQNFLVNRRQRERILGEVQAAPSDSVWEIGPGIGSMTALALDAGLDLTAFEIDHGFARILARIFADRDNFHLVEGDFLATWKAILAEKGRPTRIFGNLPYSVANAIIAVILEEGQIPGRMVFTVQKEAAQRMCARPGTKDYSAFSILCTSVCAIRLAFDLGASAFWPAPNVTSTVVSFTPRKDPVMAGDRKGFSTFVRAGFASRRKTMRNNLKSWNPANPASPANPAENRDDSSPTEASAIPDGDRYGSLLTALLAKVGKPADARAEALLPEELAIVYEGLKRGFP
jgi:16S rRNA (adenine1518-N6/adenine1519-N6)-dimethyltransferase